MSHVTKHFLLNQYGINYIFCLIKLTVWNIPEMNGIILEVSDTPIVMMRS